LYIITFPSLIVISSEIGEIPIYFEVAQPLGTRHVVMALLVA